MLNYSIKIYERNAITTVKIDSLAETLKLDESLDSGVLTIPRATKSTAFKRFSKVEISITDDDSYNETRFYLIYTTKVQLDSKGSYKTYTHTLGLIEPIKWLEKFQVGSLAFRQPLNDNKKTLLNYVERVLRLTPFVSREKIPNTRILKIDNSFSDVLRNEIAPQMTMEKKNLREVLIEIFKVVNAIPRMYYDDGMWYLTGDIVNQRKLSFDVESEIIDYKEEASGENYGQAAEIFHENTIPDDDAGIIYEGSITDYISYRSNDVIVGESNLKLILSQKNAELKNISVMVLKETGTYVESLNDYVFEKNVYDTLDFDTLNDNNDRANAFYWQYRSREINGLNERFNSIFQVMAIDNIIDKITNGFDNSVDIIFKVEYVPYFETMRSIQYREDTDPYIIEDDLFDQYSAIQINQQERLNYLYDLTDNIYGQIQRIGVETVSISKKHYTLRPYHPDTNLNGIYQLGDYTSDGYIVTKVERVYGRTHIIARYELSKNWNRIAQFIQIDQEFRPYEISLTKNDATVKRNILFNMGFIEISSNERELELNNIETLKEIFMKTFNASSFNKPITAARISVDNKDFDIAMPIASLAEKNGLKWKLDMFDTKLAGKGLRDKAFVGGTQSSQYGVYYTDDVGEITNVRIKLHNNFIDIVKPLAPYTRQLLRYMASNFPKIDKDIKYAVDTGSYFFLEQSNWLVLEIDTESNLPTIPSELSIPYYGENYLWVVVIDTYNLYEAFVDYNDFTITYTQIAGGVTGVVTEPLYQLPIYEILKDRGEILGFEINLPIVADTRNFNTFVIGESLIKENALIKPKETNQLYFYGLTSRISKTNTKKIDSSNILFSLALTGFDIFEKGLYVDSYIYENFDYFAIGDTDYNLYLGVNQLGLDGVKTIISEIYFNFVDERYRPDIVIDYIEFNPLLELNTQQNYILDLIFDIIPILEIETNIDYNEEMFSYQIQTISPQIDIRTNIISQQQKLDVQIIEIQPQLEITTDISSVSGMVFIEIIEIQPIFILETQLTHQQQQIIYEEIEIQPQIDIQVELNQLTTNRGELYWSYVSKRTTEPVTGINGGTDANISETTPPSESVYNYDLGNKVYYNDGEFPPTYYTYEVKNQFI